MATELSSCNNRTAVSYPRCSSPRMELPRRPTPSRGHQRGWRRVSLDSVHPPRPSLLSPCSQAGSTSLRPLVFTLSFRGGRRNIGKQHPAQWEARGWRRCYIPLPINIQSVEEVPHPPPHCSTHHHLHSTGGTGAPPGGGVFPPSAQHTPSHPNVRSPGVGTPSSRSLPPLWL